MVDLRLGRVWVQIHVVDLEDVLALRRVLAVSKRVFTRYAQAAIVVGDGFLARAKEVGRGERGEKEERESRSDLHCERVCCWRVWALRLVRVDLVAVGFSSTVYGRL